MLSFREISRIGSTDSTLHPKPYTLNSTLNRTDEARAYNHANFGLAGASLRSSATEFEVVAIQASKP